jgi:hypothetical protein
MLPPEDEIPAIEAPLVLLLLFLVAAPLIFFGVRYEMKLRAQAKRESAYQEALRTYVQMFKPGTRRKDVEDYFRTSKIEYLRLSLDDITKIGEDASPSWFCGGPDVYVEFRFTAATQRRGQQDEVSEQDTLGEMKISHMGGGCT